MTAPLTEQLQQLLDDLDAAVERCLAVAWLLPGDVSPAERYEAAEGALAAAQAADDAVGALMPVLRAQRPRGSYLALERAALVAWARAEMAAGRALSAPTDAERRAADRAQAIAIHANDQAGERYRLICGWVAEALIERQERRRKRDAAA